MFKKLLIATAVLAASSSIAQAFVGNPTVYLGGDIGLTINSAKNTTTYRGVTGNINLGYGGIVSPSVYLAGEVYFIPGTISVGQSSALKTSWGAGASIIPGWMLNDKTMAYARLGVSEARFTGPGQAKVGGHVGLGLQTNLCQNWDLRGEYVWNKFTSPNGFTTPVSDVVNVGIVYRFE